MQLEAVARERVPAQHADRAGVVQVAVGERLELGREHVALLGVEPSSSMRCLDRLRVERRERVEREERIVRARQRARRRLDEAVPGALRDRVALLARARCAARRRRSTRTARRASLLPMP